MSTLRVGVNVPPVPAWPSRRRRRRGAASVSEGQRARTAAGRDRDGHDQDERGRTHRRCRAMHQGTWFSTIAVRSSADPQLSEQADSTSPLAPKRWTKSAIRIAGSATLAVGRGARVLDAWPRSGVRVSDGFLHVTWYGRRRARDRGDDDLLIGKRLQRSEAATRSSRRASACRRPRPRRIRPASRSR